MNFCSSHLYVSISHLHSFGSIHNIVLLFFQLGLLHMLMTPLSLHYISLIVSLHIRLVLLSIPFVLVLIVAFPHRITFLVYLDIIHSIHRHMICTVLVVFPLVQHWSHHPTSPYCRFQYLLISVRMLFVLLLILQIVYLLKLFPRLLSLSSSLALSHLIVILALLPSLGLVLLFQILHLFHYCLFALLQLEPFPAQMIFRLSCLLVCQLFSHNRLTK